MQPEQVTYEEYPKAKEVKCRETKGERQSEGIMVKTPIEISDDILDDIAEYVIKNLEQTTVNTSFCRLLREKLDRKYGQCWHVFVGKNFGAYSVHDKNAFVNFQYQGYTYLVYKTTI